MFKPGLFSIFPDIRDKNTSSTSTAIGFALHVVFRKEAERENREKTSQQWAELIMEQFSWAKS